jgi:hypothetical protein
LMTAGVSLHPISEPGIGFEEFGRLSKRADSRPDDSVSEPHSDFCHIDHDELARAQVDEREIK